MTNNDVRLCIAVLLTILALIVLPPSTRAEPSCTGYLNGSVLRPLSQPVAMSLAPSAAADPNPALVQRFLDGVWKTGISTVLDGSENTILDLSFSVRDPGAGAPGPASGTYKGFNWLVGQPAPSGSGQTIRGTTVLMTAEAIDAASQSLGWVGSLRCTVQVNDGGALAEDLGEVIGRSLGKSLKDERFGDRESSVRF